MLRVAATALASNRLLFGVGYLVAPKRLASGWVGKAGTKDASTVLTRALGARDLVLAAGALIAMRAGTRDQARAWFAAQAVADGADLAATVLARDSLPESGFRFGAAMAGGSTAIAAAAAAGLQLDRADGGKGVTAMESKPERDREEGQPSEEEGPSNPDESVPSESDADEDLPGVPEKAGG
jgi:hypothetical protein